MVADLNDLLAGQIDGQFATCCCALVHQNGRMLIANAGHLSPYCGGVEIQTPSSIPLGVTPGIEYEIVQSENCGDFCGAPVSG